MGFPVPDKHGKGEIGGYHTALKSGVPGESRGDVERARANIEIRRCRRALPAELRDRAAAPEPVDVEAQEMVEKIIARRDGRKDSADECAFRLAVGRH